MFFFYIEIWPVFRRDCFFARVYTCPRKCAHINAVCSYKQGEMCAKKLLIVVTWRLVRSFCCRNVFILPSSLRLKV